MSRSWNKILIAGWIVSAASAWAGTVLVTEVPGGWEITGSSEQGAHILSLSQDATAPAWSDSRGNSFLSFQPPYFPAVEVTDGTRVLYPAVGAAVEIKTNAAEQADVIARSTNGLTVTWTVLPQRLGLRVDGTNATYTARLRYPTHGESCRVQAGPEVRFATAGIGTLAGAPQLLVEAKRTRALSLMPPDGSAINWRMSPLQFIGEPDYVQAELALKPGQTLWLETAPIPAYDGPVALGFYARWPFRRTTSQPAVVGSLSAARLPATLTTQLPTNTILTAALLPVTPFDPVEYHEGDPAWYWNLIDVTSQLRPLDVNGLTISAPTNTPPGIYRLRLWIVPRDWPKPEVVGGPKDTVLGFYPGMTRGQHAASQDFPTADVFVKVGTPPPLSVINPAWRRDFWRGEKINLLVQGRPASIPPLPTGGEAGPESDEGTGEGEGRLQNSPRNSEGAALSRRDVPPHPNPLPRRGEGSRRLTVRHKQTGQVVASQPLTFTTATELVLATDNLPPGEYHVEGSVYSFTIAPPRAPSMMVINSQITGLPSVAAADRLGLNAWTDIMPGGGGHAPGWADPLASVRGLVAPGTALPPARSTYDDLVRHNWLWLQGVHSRQLDFFSFHSIEDQVQENLRKHLVYAQCNQRFPSALGLVFDYDLAGVAKATSWGPGWETFGEAGEKRTKLLKARWEAYWKHALAHGANSNEFARTHNLFMAGVIDDIYQRSLKQLREHVPALRHTSSITPDHARIEDGQHVPTEYRSLDYRYLEVWNDQVYPCSANDLQETFWTSLLRMEQPVGQPLWVTIPFAHQPGTHLRRSLYTIGRGATGIGYCVEGAAGLNGGGGGADGGAWSADTLRSTVIEADVKLSGDMAARYGAFCNEFAPQEEVALLYSVSQGGSNFATESPLNCAHYTLAQLNRPARLLTEDEIAQGALARMKALLLVRQTAALPPATLAAIEQFAAAGGKVIADRDTTLPVKGKQTLPDLFWPANFWPIKCNQFQVIMNACAGRVSERLIPLIRDAPFFFRWDAIGKTQAPSLLHALGDAGRQPLEVVDGAALLATKTNGAATLVLVANENVWPFEETLTDEQLKTRYFRQFMEFGTAFYKDVRVPRPVTLRWRDERAAKPPRVYDVFAGRELRWNSDRTLTVDLATLSARALLLTPNKIAAPRVFVEQQESRATIVVRSDVPLPVRVRTGDQEVYRAATAAGSCDTFALGQESAIEVTELITGQTRRGVLAVGRVGPPGRPSGNNSARPAVAPYLEELPAVQIRDVAHVKRVLATKGLAIYVDARQAGQIDAAKRLAAKLPGAEVVFNPRVEDYVMDWVLPPDQEARNERIRSQPLLGRRRPPRAWFQWVGAMQPALVWNRPAVVFGHAGNNRLIADLNSVTLLPRPAWPEAIGAGRAFIGVAGAPFWNGQDVVYALCADAAGETAALEKLLEFGVPPLGGSGQIPPKGGTPNPLAERERQLGFEPPVHPTDLRELKLKTTTSAVGLTPCLPVASLQPVVDGVLVALGSPGRNLVRLDNRGREQWRTLTAGWYQPVELRANFNCESVVRDEGASAFHSSEFTWRHDATGQLLWKMVGKPLTAPAADGSVWVRTPDSLKRVTRDGVVAQSVELKDKFVALGRAVFVQRAGTRAGFVNSEAALVAVDLTTGKDLWKVEQCEVLESRLNDDGSLLACVEQENLARRDDLARSRLARLTVVETATGRVRLRASLGQELSGLLFAPDGQHVLALQAGYANALYLADLATGVVRQVRLPESGIWATAFAHDSRTLWIACEKLYRVAVDSLALTRVDLDRVVQLAAVPNGLVAGTSDGRVLWLNAAGQVRREVNLAGQIGVPEIRAALAPLRAAKLVASPSLRPNEFPSTVLFHQEVTHAWGDPLELRGDAIHPPVVTVHAAVAGKYRFLIPLYNAKTAGDQLGAFKLVSDDGATGRTEPVNGDKWQQAGVLELKPGVWSIRILADNWKCGPLVRDMKIEKTE